MKKKMTIKGMECEYCASQVISGLQGIKGVNSVELNFSQKTAVIETTPEVSDDQIEFAVEAADCKIVEIKEIQ